MTHSQIKTQKINLQKQSRQFTQQELDAVMLQNPNITCNGLELPTSKDFAKNRHFLKESLEAFQYCCAYLRLCKKTKTPCRDSLHSGYLKSHVETVMKIYVPSGAIVAAAECLGIKYYSNIKNTPFVKLYISSKLPFTLEQELVAREL